jgi:outer membrane autotransporter protein
MNFDSKRYITGSSGEFAAGNRSGHQVFGSLTSGYEYRANGFLISPYGRLRASWSMLDAFTETGGGFFALQYGAQSITSFTAGFGLRTSYEFREPWGAITPRMRIEYAHEFAGGSTASVAYADLVGAGGSVYTLPISPTGSDYVITGIGTDIRFISDWILGIDYRTAFGQEKIAPQLVQIKLGTKF